MSQLFTLQILSLHSPFPQQEFFTSSSLPLRECSPLQPPTLSPSSPIHTQIYSTNIGMNVTRFKNHMSLIFLNPSCPNCSIKKRITMDCKAGFIILLHSRNITKYQWRTFPQSKGLEKYFPFKETKEPNRCSHANISQNTFPSKLITRDGKQHFILIRVSIHLDEITILNR